MVLGFTFKVLGWALLAVYGFLALNEVFDFLGNVKPLSYLFADRLWVVNFTYLMVLSFQGYHWYKQLKKA